MAHSLHTVSGATVPVMSFILGAVLYRGPGTGRVRWPLVLAVCAVRLAVIPLLGAVVVFASEAAGWWVPIDPLFVFTLASTWEGGGGGGRGDGRRGGRRDGWTGGGRGSALPPLPPTPRPPALDLLPLSSSCSGSPPPPSTCRP